MTHVTGIGGVFVRTRDPEAMTAWYRDTLGVFSDPVWPQEAGPTVVAMFARDTTYFDRPEQAFMLNFRVRDLDALVAELQGKGLDVIRKADWDTEYGRFARIHDPEGNPVELWEPPKEA